MGKRAAIYSRVSTAEQAEEDKASLTEQERRCREYCLEKGYDVVVVYSSTSSLPGRPTGWLGVSIPVPLLWKLSKNPE